MILSWLNEQKLWLFKKEHTVYTDNSFLANMFLEKKL